MTQRIGRNLIFFLCFTIEFYKDFGDFGDFGDLFCSTLQMSTTISPNNKNRAQIPQKPIVRGARARVYSPPRRDLFKTHSSFYPDLPYVLIKNA